jgi:hypothetical protein
MEDFYTQDMGSPDEYIRRDRATLELFERSKRMEKNHPNR